MTKLEDFPNGRDPIYGRRFISTTLQEESTVFVNTSARLCPFPTNNCQLHSIENAQNIVTRGNAKDILRAVITEAKIGGVQLLLDVKPEYARYIDGLFNNKFVIRQQYNSTNGDDMVLFVVRCADLIK